MAELDRAPGGGTTDVVRSGTPLQIGAEAESPPVAPAVVVVVMELGRSACSVGVVALAGMASEPGGGGSRRPHVRRNRHLSV